MLRRVMFICVLSVTSLAAAQPPDAADPSSTVRAWYQRFLGREPDRVGLRSWTEALRVGGDERDVLAKILGGGEYYWRAGGNDEEFVRRLWFDLAGQEADQQLLQETLAILRTEGRERAARALLERVVTADADSAQSSRAWREQLLRETERLNTSLEYLAEDIVVELSGREERRAYNDVEQILSRLDNFQRLLRSSSSPARHQEAFRTFDEEVHAMVTNVRALAADRPALLLRVQDVLRVDRRVHAIIFADAEEDNDSRRWFVRQSALLADELQQLRRTAAYALGDGRRAARLLARLDELTRSADQLAAAADGQTDRDKFTMDLAAISAQWSDAAVAINELPAEGNSFLRRSASRVDRVLDRLEEALKVQGSRTYLYVR